MQQIFELLFAEAGQAWWHRRSVLSCDRVLRRPQKRVLEELLHRIQARHQNDVIMSCLESEIAGPTQGPRRG